MGASGVPFPMYMAAIVCAVCIGLFFLVLKFHEEKEKKQRLVDEAEKISKSLWKLEDVKFYTDSEDKEFLTLTLTHCSWNRSQYLAVRMWHPNYHEFARLLVGSKIGFEALTHPIMPEEDYELSGYLRLKDVSI